MITLDQIKKLDQKVQAAVSRISSLKQENTVLQQKLDEYQKRIGELEVLISDFKRDQSEIESGILRALEQLDRLEDSVDNSDSVDDSGSEVETAEEEPDASDDTDAGAGASADTGAPSGSAAVPPDAATGDKEDEIPEGESEEPADQDESELDIF